MKKIYKYSLQMSDEFAWQVDMPMGSVILSFQVQNDTPTIWVSQYPDMKEFETRKFFMVGTGHQFDGDSIYIGTIQVGRFVWHLFEVNV